MNHAEDVADAARMVAFAMGRGRVPAHSRDYHKLVQRFDVDPAFAHMVRMVAKGFDLTVLDVDHRSGLVLGTTPESEFAISPAELVSAPADRPLYLLAQLTIASLAFPRPEDLDNDEHVGRVSVARVDELVRAHARDIERRLDESGVDTDPPAGKPGLEALWRAYLRRNATGKTKGDHTPHGATQRLVERAIKHLVAYGFLRWLNEEDGGTYTTHVKYRLQVRDLAAGDMLEELASMGIAAMPKDSHGAPPPAAHGGSEDALPAPEPHAFDRLT
ncbi:hypothetical protein [Streptomyces sp. NBC_01803]|uniref:hypothetical protein n=1 Tax=Streptomyces sp. NBC_01803 TaxID=2975946 RepID=UPI002DD9DCE0|nr:hypothetical protein [Streptomyces sp. NBC_01803]WSA46389.1 hypothetical protein OIE51_20680 [Streptomyces sp. NBC_01803]